ncbi:hypothetical protein LIER_24654 [Lithospermum erythrorhizon]|uniref:Uncharacterized protein n=1 Tax=Lithospermum erythrorhizon TaxID=34254 RepID=A0AAV3R325_LITER
MVILLDIFGFLAKKSRFSPKINGSCWNCGIKEKVGVLAGIRPRMAVLAGFGGCWRSCAGIPEQFGQEEWFWAADTGGRVISGLGTTIVRLVDMHR